MNKSFNFISLYTVHFFIFDITNTLYTNNLISSLARQIIGNISSLDAFIASDPQCPLEEVVRLIPKSNLASAVLVRRTLAPHVH